jgi:hypothetical protein
MRTSAWLALFMLLLPASIASATVLGSAGGLCDAFYISRRPSTITAFEFLRRRRLLRDETDLTAMGPAQASPERANG